MIPLRLRVIAEGDERTAFVVKLLHCGRDADGTVPDDMLEEHGATLVAELPGELVFRTGRGYLRVPGASFAELDGDVLYVDAQRGTAHRWIRARSRHNTLLVTEQCDQLCLMCSQPPKKHHLDLFGHFGAAMLLAPPDAEIGLSGGEPTLYKKQLLELIASVAAARPDLRFHILTNAQHFVEEDLSVLRGPPFSRVCWGVPLYAADPRTHDDIVGKEGAFATLLNSLALLLRAGASVELRTVIIKPNLSCLRELARFVAMHLRFVDTWALMQLENIGFARMRWGELFVDHSTDFQAIADAVDIASAHGIPVALYNCPRCTVPACYRCLAGPTISDWKRRYLEACSHCRERDMCSGFFEWYPDKQGFREIHPL